MQNVLLPFFNNFSVIHRLNSSQYPYAVSVVHLSLKISLALINISLILIILSKKSQKAVHAYTIKLSGLLLPYTSI